VSSTPDCSVICVRLRQGFESDGGTPAGRVNQAAPAASVATVATAQATRPRPLDTGPPVVSLRELLARHAAPVVLVNQATDRIQTLYLELGYTLRFLEAPRRISCPGDRQPALEVLATRNL